MLEGEPPRIEWQGATARTADDLVAAADTRGTQPQTDDVALEDAVREMLDADPSISRDRLAKMLRERGIRGSTDRISKALQRARPVPRKRGRS